MEAETNSTTSNARQSLEDELNDLLQDLFELNVVVYDFQPNNGNKLVRQKINSILEHYKKIDELKDNVEEYVPEEVIRFIEQGTNPDIFTQGFVERAATENQFTNGKIQAVAEFHKLLSDEFTTAFPDLYDNADDMLKSALAPSESKQ